MKKVLITGASSGFGKLLAQQLSLRGGYQIIAAMRNTSGANAQAGAELAAAPAVSVRELDVTSDDDVRRLMEEHPAIDILINNAGVFGGGILEAHSIAQAQKLFDVNVFGAFRMMKAVLPAMRRKEDGLIINISSMLGFFSIPLNAVYCASKFALEALVTGSYPELIQKGVENILVEPGSFPTELYQKPGIKADLDEVTLSYGDMVAQMTEYANKAVYNALQKSQPDPRAVVDKIIQLIEMEKGTRPVRNPIDQISGEAFSKKLANDLAELADTQMKAYGF